MLPNRVVKVGSSENEVHLYISNGEAAEYATLSHCWGGSHPLITETATLEDRKQSLEFD
jgi:hypothetical protein